MTEDVTKIQMNSKDRAAVYLPALPVERMRSPPKS
jgi:hypothetical protein